MRSVSFGGPGSYELGAHLNFVNELRSAGCYIDDAMLTFFHRYDGSAIRFDFSNGIANVGPQPSQTLEAAVQGNQVSIPIQTKATPAHTSSFHQSRNSTVSACRPLDLMAEPGAH